MAKLSIASIKKKVSEKAKGFCEYCLLPQNYSVSTFELEHINPISNGGKTTLQNLAWACSGCNKHKSHKVSIFDSETGETVLFFNPRKDKWNEHFAWSEDFTEIIPPTAKGRITIRALQLNRKGLINLRKILRLVGEHPPE